MKNIYYKLLSHFPSKKGLKASLELQKFFAKENRIEFAIEEFKDETGHYFVAESINLNKRHIITSGGTWQELEYNIKDAVFTAFHVPAFYCNFDCLSFPIRNGVKLEYAKN